MKSYEKQTKIAFYALASPLFLLRMYSAILILIISEGFLTWDMESQQLIQTVFVSYY